MPSALDKIRQIAEAKPATKKSSGFEHNDPALDEPLEEYLAAVARQKSAAALVTTLKATLLEAVGPVHVRMCRAAGAVKASVRLNGRANFIRKNAYSAVALENADDLKKTFGRNFGTFFTEAVTITVRSPTEEVVGKLFAALGEEEFARIFDVGVSVKPTAAFHEAVILDPKVEAKARPLMAQEVIKAWTPSIS